LSILGYISDAPDRTAEASDGQRHLAEVLALNFHVTDALHAGWIRAELDRDRPRLSGEDLARREAELARYEALAAEAREYLGVGPDATADEIHAAALALAEQAGLTPSELDAAEDYLEPPCHPQFTPADVLTGDVAGESTAPPPPAGKEP
jgi:hypothetical protein